MEPNPAELFLHIFGVIGVFVGYGTLLLATTALGRARKIEEVRVIAEALTAGRRIGFEQISVIDMIVVVAVLVVGVTGLDMARYTGDWHSGWVPVAIVSLLLLAPVGPVIINPRMQAIARAAAGDSIGEMPRSVRSRVEDQVLSVALKISFAILIGITFLMTLKPSLLWSVAAMMTAMAGGAAWAAARMVANRLVRHR